MNGLGNHANGLENFRGTQRKRDYAGGRIRINRNQHRPEFCLVLAPHPGIHVLKAIPLEPPPRLDKLTVVLDVPPEVAELPRARELSEDAVVAQRLHLVVHHRVDKRQVDLGNAQNVHHHVDKRQVDLDRAK